MKKGVAVNEFVAALLDGAVVTKILSFDDFRHWGAAAVADPVWGC